MKSTKTLKKKDEILERMNMIDSELVSFYEFCEHMGFTPREMEVICSPLQDIISKHNFKKLLRAILLLGCFFGIVYGCTQISTLAVHATAIARIALIEVIFSALFINSSYQPELLTLLGHT